MVQGSSANTTPDRVLTVGTHNALPNEKRKKVGNYVILKTIGEGSFAKVRLGVHLLTEMKVAIKVINKREVFKRNYLRANLRREAAMMQRMSHTNIVQLHEVMETENSYYIVMDLVEGNEFVKYLTKKKQLGEDETRKYIRQIVSAVDHMHHAYVIHRDIKLQNFMLDKNNDIVIIDFGLSNCLEERGFLATQCGSPAYAAPEIFAHQEYGTAVDIWSIGVNMYAMLVGRLPFKVENRSRNLVKLHACILKGCEIPATLSRDCRDLLSRLLDPSPTKRITIQEILHHPFLIGQLGPIERVPYKPRTDRREINESIIRYLAMKYGYSEHETEEAVVYRRPIASRALYILIERRLKEGLGWPDRTYNNSVNTYSSTPAIGGVALTDEVQETNTLDKLNRHEPLLPGRRAIPQVLPQQISPLTTNGPKYVREKSNYVFDEQVLVRTNTNVYSTANGITQDPSNESVPQSRLAPRKLSRPMFVRKSPAVGSNTNQTGEHIATRKVPDSTSLASIKNSMSTQRDNTIFSERHQQQKLKPHSLPNSILNHTNQDRVHLQHELSPSQVGATGSISTTKHLDRASDAERTKKPRSQSPVRYNANPSVAAKAIGLLLRNPGLHSRVSSSSSKSSKNITGAGLDTQQPSPPLRFYPSTANASNQQSVSNYHSHGNLILSDSTEPRLVKTPALLNRMPTNKIKHPTTPTTATSGKNSTPT